MRIVQGKEPPHFMLIFKGTLIIRQGGNKSAFTHVKKVNSAFVLIQSSIQMWLKFKFADFEVNRRNMLWSYECCCKCNFHLYSARTCRKWRKRRKWCERFSNGWTNGNFVFGHFSLMTQWDLSDFSSHSSIPLIYACTPPLQFFISSMIIFKISELKKKPVQAY